MTARHFTDPKHMMNQRTLTVTIFFGENCDKDCDEDYSEHEDMLNELFGGGNYKSDE